MQSFFTKKICKKVQFDETAHCLPQELKLMGFLENFSNRKGYKRGQQSDKEISKVLIFPFEIELL